MKYTRLNKSTTKASFIDDEKNVPYAQSDVVMLGVACDLTASYNKGAWHGPHAIIDASYQVEYATPGFHIPLTDKVHIHNFGILECIKSVDACGVLIEHPHEKIKRAMDAMVQKTEKISERVLRDDKFLMLFGGDHSVPNGVWNAMETVYGKDVTILQFDGHLDLRDELEGFRYSHACIMRRARDKGFRVVQVGPRDHISEEEADYVKMHRLQDDIYFCATQPEEFYQRFNKRIRNGGVINPSQLIRHGELNKGQLASLEDKIARAEHLWISIDVDGLDASHIPGTGTPLPLGLSRSGMRNAIYHAIRAAQANRVHIVGFDINEVSPQLKKEGPYSPMNTVTTMNEMDAALLAYNILFWNYIDRF